ncbi:MAG: response regulator, partial [Lachnospiraceae bacterium]|nr:response regulator [Lachnospiraceae bacterium]
MRIAICDDEKEIRDMLVEKIERFYPKADLLLYQSGEELLLTDAEPDILLLDIQMSGKNGMETARELRRKNKKTILIFVTALEDFVFQAFDVGAFHYFVKPFGDNKYAEDLGNAIKYYDERKSRNAVDSDQGNKNLLIMSGGKH